MYFKKSSLERYIRLLPALIEHFDIFEEMCALVFLRQLFLCCALVTSLRQSSLGSAANSALALLEYTGYMCSQLYKKWANTYRLFSHSVQRVDRYARSGSESCGQARGAEPDTLVHWVIITFVCNICGVLFYIFFY